MYETSDLYAGMRPIEILTCPSLASAHAEQLWSVAVMLGTRCVGVARASVTGVYGADFEPRDLLECLAELCERHDLEYELAPAAAGHWSVVLCWAHAPAPRRPAAPLARRILRSVAGCPLLPANWGR